MKFTIPTLELDPREEENRIARMEKYRQAELLLEKRSKGEGDINDTKKALDILKSVREEGLL